MNQKDEQTKKTNKLIAELIMNWYKEDGQPETWMV